VGSGPGWPTGPGSGWPGAVGSGYGTLVLLEVDGRDGRLIGGLSPGDGPGVYPLLGAMPVGPYGVGSTGPGLTAEAGTLFMLPNPPLVLGLLGAVVLLKRGVDGFRVPPELLAGAAEKFPGLLVEPRLPGPGLFRLKVCCEEELFACPSEPVLPNWPPELPNEFIPPWPPARF